MKIDRSRPLEVCRIETCNFIKHKIDNDNISTNKAIQLVADETGIPFKTIEKWVYPKASENYNLKRKLERQISSPTSGGTLTIGEDISPDERLDMLENLNQQILKQSAKIRKEKRIKQQLTASKPVKVDLPVGKYRTIVIDPPWPMNKIIRDTAPNQDVFDYPTMSIEEIKAFDLPSFAADDTHLFLWTTQRFLPSSLDILKHWGFNYIFTMVWHKPGGFQPFNLPQYNCEFVVYGRKGTPVFDDTKDFFTCFKAPRREHSRKPDEFYDVLTRTCPAPRIDVFSREIRTAWAQYGNEIDKFGGE